MLEGSKPQDAAQVMEVPIPMRTGEHEVELPIGGRLLGVRRDNDTIALTVVGLLLAPKTSTRFLVVGTGDTILNASRWHHIGTVMTDGTVVKDGTVERHVFVYIGGLMSFYIEGR